MYASPDYLKKFGQPKSMEDLNDHRLISFGENHPNYLRDMNWLETAGLPPD